MPTALVLVQNQIPDPEQAWPHIHDTLRTVLEQKEITELRVLLGSPNDLEVLDKTWLPTEIRCLSWPSIKSWSDAWITDLFRIVGQLGPDWVWYGDRLDVSQSPVHWKLERVDLLVLIRDQYQPGTHTPILFEAWERGLTVCRVDPVTYGAFRVTAPEVRSKEETKEEDND